MENGERDRGSGGELGSGREDSMDRVHAHVPTVAEGFGVVRGRRQEGHAVYCLRGRDVTFRGRVAGKGRG